MQKNWYIVYTKPHQEGKVALLLAKKRIEFFLPKNRTTDDPLKRNRVIKKPLFPSYVFVHSDLTNRNLLLQVMGVINFVYWKGLPAKIQNEEIELINKFTTNFFNVKLEKSQVNQQENIKYIDEPNYYIDGNIFSSRNKILKVYLPSLGFIMTAKVNDESFYQKETIFLQNKPVGLS